MIRALARDELAGDAFVRLLWLAAELDDAELRRIVREELPELTTLGVVEDGRPVAFVAFDPRTRPATIEYIAVDGSTQGHGWGSALVDAVQDRVGGAVFAQTDDDAVDFYRRIGFDVTAGEPDPRWPDRRRYDCVRRQRP